MPGFSIFSLGLVLLTASLVAIISRRLKLPYSVGLVMAGITLALLPIAIELPLTRDLIFNVFLPPSHRRGGAAIGVEGFSTRATSYRRAGISGSSLAACMS